MTWVIGIVGLSLGACFGVFIMALFKSGKTDDPYDDQYHE